MCRHIAYLGPPVTLHELMYGPPHSLFKQSYAPREQKHGTVNADGFGVGWYDAGRPEPLRYRRAMPIWADASFADVARVTRSGCAVAAVRTATAGFPTDESCNQPFRGDGFVFSHNGAIERFDTVADKLASEAAPDVAEARAPVDSAVLFAMAVRFLRGGAPLAEALAETVRTARAHANGRYNLLAADGAGLAATACGDTLYTRSAAHPEGPATVIASEPCDDAPGWRRIPDGSLVTATAEGTTIRPLEESA